MASPHPNVPHQRPRNPIQTENTNCPHLLYTTLYTNFPAIMKLAVILALATSAFAATGIINNEVRTGPPRHPCSAAHITNYPLLYSTSRLKSPKRSSASAPPRPATASKCTTAAPLRATAASSTPHTTAASRWASPLARVRSSRAGTRVFWACALARSASLPSSPTGRMGAVVLGPSPRIAC